MYEQQRKQQGLPTTDEEKQYEALKTAWDSEGSPFKGTPFDPSKLNLNGFQPWKFIACLWRYFNSFLQKFYRILLNNIIYH